MPLAIFRQIKPVWQSVVELQEVPQANGEGLGDGAIEGMGVEDGAVETVSPSTAQRACPLPIGPALPQEFTAAISQR